MRRQKIWKLPYLSIQAVFSAWPKSQGKEGVYVIIGNPAFCMFLYLTGVHFRRELQHGGDVSQQKLKCQPIRTREIDGILLSDVLYVNI